MTTIKKPTLAAFQGSCMGGEKRLVAHAPSFLGREDVATIESEHAALQHYPTGKADYMRNPQQALTTTIFGNLHELSLGMRLRTTSLLLQTVNGE